MKINSVYNLDPPFFVGNDSVLENAVKSLKKLFRRNYFVYILLCKDNSYYTGLTNNLLRRLDEHQSGKYTKSYTNKRRPVHLKYFEVYRRVWDALTREKQIKGWTRGKKDALINGNIEELKKLAKGRR